MTVQPRPVLPVAIPGGLVVLYAVGVSLTIYLESRAGVRSSEPMEQIALVAAFGWFLLLGALLLWRQPRNPMGWIFATIALLVAVGAPGPAYVDLMIARGRPPSPGLAMLAWPNQWYWWLLLGLMFVFVPLLFPDGRLPSRRWRPLAWLAGLSIAGVCLLGALAETVTTQGGSHALANPIGVAGLAGPEESLSGTVLFAGLLAGVIGGLSSLVVRFRRGHAQERLQIKWLLLATAVVVVLLVVEPVEHHLPIVIRDGLWAIAINALPLAIAAAILRYRLYDIDRVISRTVSYVVLTALLIGVYAAGVVGLGAVLRALTGGEGGDLVVAASTLATAAAFRPLRRRVQAVVDRRFDRARYDAHHTVESFGRRLRDEVDLDALTDDLRGVVAGTLRPGHVSVWLHAGGGR
jgi:hypothetical protein